MKSTIHPTPTVQDRLTEELTRKLCANWDKWSEAATAVACDAFEEMLRDHPDKAEALLGPVLNLSDYWMEQIVRAIVELPSDDTGELEVLSYFLDKKLAECVTT